MAEVLVFLKNSTNIVLNFNMMHYIPLFLFILGEAIIGDFLKADPMLG